MKRLIILAYDFPPNNGGVARLCGEIRHVFMENGIQVLTIVGCNGEDSDDIKRIKGYRGLKEWRIYKHLKKTLQKGDIILTDTFHPMGIIGILTGYPTYILAHGAEYMPGKGFFRRKIWPHYRKWVLGKARMIVANSHYTQNLVKSCNKKCNVITLPLAVDHNKFYPSKRKRDDGILNLCSISRLEKFKGQDFIIQTIAGLPKQYKKKIRLDIGGKGPYKPTLERTVNNFGLNDIVHFLGFLDDNSLNDFYSEHDVFILCTREDPSEGKVEGFGLVFVEAQACETAVIGCETGGIPDAVENGKGGWLIHQDNQKELEALLIYLIEHPQIVKEFGSIARKRVVEKYTWKHYFSELSTVLK